ncbi:hypothetical protein AK830_g10784 [Neonectria ditissima]|uniref:Zn(2)-C6 fungal-type domain-containing protein n=1 Tax=Neonectria ditissima TaxID=78410 RepID=A0A0P7B2Y7_9HYPO|nr:hypothetical protein AK830_g10784 [Neonectria ditissima]
MVTSRGLYAIVNVHHDSALWADYTVSNADSAMIEEKFYRLWYQIGTKLACTSSRVAFEPLNEPRGESDEHAAQLSKLNDIFLRAIADAGGFNPQRVVTLGGLGQDIQRSIKWFERPSSEFCNPYALQVHYYAPYDFTSAAWGKTIWGSDADKAQLDDAFAELRSTFPDVPIVIGEWLVSPVHSEPAARWRYYDFLARTSIKYGFAPMMWDTGNDILDRSSHKMFDVTGVEVHLRALEGIHNSLPEATTDASAASQFSSAFAFHRVGDAIQAQTLPFSFNENLVTSIAVDDRVLAEGTDYAIIDNGIRFHSSVLSDYFDTNAAGVKATALVSFSAGASIPIQFVVWDTPTVPIASSVAVAGSEVSVAVNWRGVSKPATVAAFKADGSPLVDEWTVYLPPLGRGRTTFVPAKLNLRSFRIPTSESGLSHESRPAMSEFRPRRTHKKSRGGCRPCKDRHVKCDEIRPQCVNCLTNERQCSYTSEQLTRAPRTGALSGLLPQLSSYPMFSLQHMSLLVNVTDNPAGFIMCDEPSQAIVSDIIKPALEIQYVMDVLLALSALQRSLQNPSDSTDYRLLSIQLQGRALSVHNDSALDSSVNSILPRFIFSMLLGYSVLHDTLSSAQRDMSIFIEKFGDYLPLIQLGKTMPEITGLLSEHRKYGTSTLPWD